ncbi:MAG TPA: COX15/CtaA family protein [Bdellovibrionota bacterium]
MNKVSYQRFALGVLLACVAVIVWGAYVRASGSGAGCGSHWPLCNGVLLPQTEAQKTWIEFSHRLSSGLLLVLVGGLAAWAWKIFPSGSFALRVAVTAFVAVLLEALIGAFLVLLRLVEHDQSVLRVISISLHLVNTLFLLAALTCAYLSAGELAPRWSFPSGQRLWPRGLILGFAALGALGAVAALGDTLFPPSSVLAGIALDLSGTGHVAERIRVLHPLLAVGWVGAFAWWVSALWERFPSLKKQGMRTLSLACGNLLLGLCNILFLAPVSLQMLHLLVADALWISFVALLFSAASRWQREPISGTS